MRRLFFILACLLSPLLIPSAWAGWNSSPSLPMSNNFNKLLDPGLHLISLRLDDHTRKFAFVTPKNFKLGDDPWPIVFFFHGAGGSAIQALRTYGWAEKADAENFFAAFPEGLPVLPNGNGPLRIWRDERGDSPMDVDDVHFFAELLTKLETVLPIDKRRVFVTGFSNGAGMAFTLGAHFPNRIAAIAPVSSQSFTRVDSLTRPLPVYYLTGTADPLIPYHGGKMATPLLPFGKDDQYPPVQTSVDYWARLDGCPCVPQLLSNQNGVRVLRYGPGKGDSEIIFTTIEGNGHHWPGTVEPLPHLICGPTRDPFHATNVIWDFFKNHPIPDSN